MKEKTLFADDDTESLGLLVRLRLPWLFVGLLGGVMATFLVSRFEEILSQNLSLVFFLPLIVYMGDAVGTQTETIFVRNMARGRVKVPIYIFKEFLLGLVFGAIFGFLIGLLANLWLGSKIFALTIGLAMFATVTTAPLVALLVPAILRREHKDPALGSGPFTTVLQDLTSLLIYFAIASLILFR